MIKLSQYKKIHQFSVDVEWFQDGYVIFSPDLHIAGGGKNLTNAFKDFLETMIYMKKNLQSTPPSKLAPDAKEVLKKLKKIKRISR